MAALCAGFGVKFNRFELQAVYLEMDRDRSGVITEGDLIVTGWFLVFLALNLEMNFLRAHIYPILTVDCIY